MATISKTFTENYSSTAIAATWEINVLTDNPYARDEYFSVSPIRLINARYQSSLKDKAMADIIVELGINGNTIGSYRARKASASSSGGLTIYSPTDWRSGRTYTLDKVTDSFAGATAEYFNSNNPTTRSIPITGSVVGATLRSYYSSTQSSTDNAYNFPTPTSLGTVANLILNAPPTFDVATTSTSPYYRAGSYYTVSVSNATAQYGGTITSSKLTIGDNFVNGSGDGTMTIVPMVAGTFTPTITVTDSRGQTTTKSLDPITVLPNTIEITDLDTYRVSSGDTTGTWIPSDEGTYSIIEMEVTYTAGNPTTSLAEPTVMVNGVSTSLVTWYESYDSSTGVLSNPITWTSYAPASPVRIYGFYNSEISQNDSYTFQVQQNKYWNTYITYSEAITSTIGIAFFLLAGRAGGKGLGIGMKPLDDNLYINMDTYLKGVSGAIGYIFDLIYPVGSIYTSVNSTDPELLFGGEWERITGKFLLAATDGGASGGNSRADIVAGGTGGEAAHLLKAAESGQKAGSTENGNATHSHNPNTTSEYFVTCATAESNNTRVAYNSSGNRLVDGMTNTSTSVFHHRKATDSQNASHAHSITGSDATTEHNNMPPYLAVYVWKRIA